ncbi:MAG: hypothetical protein J6Y66_03430, partial [Bacteroidales bacterium]|nr:hypothetical protein [Bacteroidales bacterium]
MKKKCYDGSEYHHTKIQIILLPSAKTGIFRDGGGKTGSPSAKTAIFRDGGGKTGPPSAKTAIFRDGGGK